MRSSTAAKADVGTPQEAVESLLDLANQVSVNTAALTKVLDGTWGQGEEQSWGTPMEQPEPAAESIVGVTRGTLLRSVGDLQGIRERLLHLLREIGQ